MGTRARPRSAGTLGLFLARSRAQAGLLTTIGIIVGILTGLLAGLVGFLGLSGTMSARAALSTASSTAAGYRFDVAATDDPAGQESAGEEVFARELAGTAVTVTSLYSAAPEEARTDGMPIADEGGAPARIALAAGQDLLDHALLVSGRWPAPMANGSPADAADPEAVLHDSALRTLGLSLGDVVELGPEDKRLDIRIVGSWLPQVPEDPFWFSDPFLLAGEGLPAADGTRSFGPLVLAATPRGTALAGREGTIQWAMLPDPDRIEAGDLTALVTAAGRIQRALGDNPATSNGRVSVTGELEETAARLTNSLNAIRGITPIGLILVAVIGTITLAQVSRLLIVGRRPDSALLLSRGATRARLIAHSAVEAGLVCVLGAAIGSGLAQVLLAAWGTTVRSGTNVSAADIVVWAAAVAAASAAVIVATGLVDLLRGAPNGIADQAHAHGIARGRGRAIVAAGTIALTVGSAALAIAQSLVYGSPIVTDAAGRQSVDPLAVLAPALGLVAACLVLLAVAVPLSGWAERLAARGRMLQPVFSARQLARGLARSFAAILVIALAVGALAITATYSGTRAALDASTGQLRVGADQRVVLRAGSPGFAGLEPVLAEPYRALEGVGEAAPVLVTGIRMFDRVAGTMTAIDAQRLPEVMTDVGGSVDTAGLASELPSGPAFGVEVPEGATSVTMLGNLTGLAPVRDGPVAASAQVTGTTWFESSDGSLIASRFGPVDLPTGSPMDVAAETALPTGTAWRIVAVDVEAAASQYWSVELEVTGFDASGPSGGTIGVPFAGGDWTSQLALSETGFSDPPATFRSTADSFAIGLSLRYGNRDSARAMAVSESAPLAGQILYGATVKPLPVAISRSLADARFLSPGDTFEVELARVPREVTVQVVDVVENVPGTPSNPAVLADLRSLNEHLLRTNRIVPTANEVWMSTGGTPVSVSGVADAGAAVTTPAGSTVAAITAPAEVSLWLAASGSMLFGALSLSAVVLTTRRARRVDVVVLRAEGLTAGAQARARLGETSVISAAAILFGLAGGILVSSLTVPNLARTVVLEAPADLGAPLLAAPWPGLVLLGLLAVALAIVAVADAAAVRRQAAEPGTRWES